MKIWAKTFEINRKKIHIGLKTKEWKNYRESRSEKWTSVTLSCTLEPLLTSHGKQAEMEDIWPDWVVSTSSTGCPCCVANKQLPETSRGPGAYEHLEICTTTTCVCSSRIQQQQWMDDVGTGNKSRRCVVRHNRLVEIFRQIRLSGGTGRSIIRVLRVKLDAKLVCHVCLSFRHNSESALGTGCSV